MLCARAVLIPFPYNSKDGAIVTSFKISFVPEPLKKEVIFYILDASKMAICVHKTKEMSSPESGARLPPVRERATVDLSWLTLDI